MRYIQPEFNIKVGYAFSSGSECSNATAARKICGDTAISCRLPDGSLALMLSDGMGKGIKAAADSKLVVTRLRRNLKNGMPPSKAIKEVNRYMIYGASDLSNESFATADITIIDRKTCQAKFYKMGAATTFIVRGQKVKKIEQQALPVGIIPKIKSSYIAAQLGEGDVIIMVSDGVTDADREDPESCWLLKFLTHINEGTAFEYINENNATHSKTVFLSQTPRILAQTVLQMAQEKYGHREQDDLTVAVAVIAKDDFNR